MGGVVPVTRGLSEALLLVFFWEEEEEEEEEEERGSSVLFTLLSWPRSSSTPAVACSCLVCSFVRWQA